MKKIIFVLAAFLLAGCSTSLPINYIPSAVIKGEGEIVLGDFSYIPADMGKVKQNEMQKAGGAIGNLYTTESISDIVKKAFRKELVSSGFTVSQSSNIVIDANIDKFLYDWVGFVEVDFYINMTFKVIKDGQVVMEYSSKSHQAAPKTTIQDTEAIRSALSNVFDEFLLEARNRKVL
ncbi:hypothetical protein [Pragia fontium]|uniref:hypothetical protein n=1 Tax=Pragia fontium TaxID=82985 RepID=UPI00064AAA12|nr:hypothetical protein [Pragia fontium]AKJ42724.1 hypothetical protein QQ39_12050 [Pragia fontium]